MSSYEEPTAIQFLTKHQVVNLLSLIHVKRATLIVETSPKEKAIKVYGVAPTKGDAVRALREMPQRNYNLVNCHNAIFDVIMMLAVNLHLSSPSLRVISASGRPYVGKLVKQ